MKWLLVLGATSDIAAATARQFAATGFNLYLTCRGPAAHLESSARDLEVRYNIKTRILEFDVLKTELHDQWYRALPVEPEGVLCAIGCLGDQRLAQQDSEAARVIIETNFTGIVSILDIIAADFSNRLGGFIIAISSVAGDRGRQSNYYYGSAKAGLSVYLSGLRNRLHKKKVRVITVKPGFVRTKMTEGMKLSPRLTAEPEEAGRDIFKAYQSGRDVVYTKWFWRWIMMIIIHIPERIFKRMSL